ncbi:peptide-N4-asparagine amidase A [Streptomyces roseirectus]|uniref:Peptide-N4-asparagine amidase A n=1 Tax=Streptomyces roseirectus TaxID=2768066 RepID=A0A7H0IGV2_9ACTN|nr:peptide-N4-asparagine amidase [Streptomyces roseirectus]QNP72018.1 peptide-N4-asparagine amidase A [Streptomyces roseirectus]
MRPARAPGPARPGTRRARTVTVLTAAVAAFGLSLGSASAATVPAEFGTDYHDPVTAAPPIAAPHTRSCTVTVAQTRFKDFTPYTGTYTPPTGCGTPGRWSKVVLRLDGSVKGRQFDRLGYLDIGGVQVLRTSTPEPSQDGIDWSVEKDVTQYGNTLSTPQPVDMLIGNVVDDTYTGVLDVKVTLTFYAPRPGRTSSAPDRVIPLSDGNSVTTGASLTVPRNSERILAEVYATGSGGGCEEFWYSAVTPSASYSCKGGDDGPYREVLISVDGKVAGIASPYPNVWTGGWSPYLWSVIPSPHSFDVRPLVYDLTPFAGVLNDGKAHKVDVSVIGVPAGQTGWSAPTNVLVWQDAHKAVVTGAVTSYKRTGPAVSNHYTDGARRELVTSGADRLKVTGYVDTSHGRVTTTVERTLTTAIDHTWTPDENSDDQTGKWTDHQAMTTGGRVSRTDRAYALDGRATIDSANRLRVVMSVGDRATLGATRTDDEYRGDATFTLGVARDQRHAVATTGERYRVRGPGVCYDHALATEQGVLTKDVRGC